MDIVVHYVPRDCSTRNPFDPRERMVKRLIALGGDWVRPQDKGLMVFVPKGYCWVEGDNQGISGDSNHFGAVSLANESRSFHYCNTYIHIINEGRQVYACGSCDKHRA